MKQLSINQIMLFLDIARGTDTQVKVSTRKYDHKVLAQRQFISVKEDQYQLTKPGRVYLEKLKAV